MHSAGSIHSAPAAVLRRLGRGDRDRGNRARCRYPRRGVALHVDREFPFVPGPGQNTGVCHPRGIGSRPRSDEWPFQRRRTGLAQDHILSGLQDGKSNAPCSTHSGADFTRPRRGKTAPTASSPLDKWLTSARSRLRILQGTWPMNLFKDALHRVDTSESRTGCISLRGLIVKNLPQSGASEECKSRRARNRAAHSSQTGVIPSNCRARSE
jgi:hypothetical protein